MPLSRKRFELFFWAAVPSGLCWVLFMLRLIPTHIWGIASIMPLLPLFPVYYWGRDPGGNMPAWFVCCLGVLMDVVSGLPMGLSALLYLAFLVALHSEHSLSKQEGFSLVWVYFSLLIIILCLLQWLVMSLFGNQVAALPSVLLQILFTIGCYPAFHRVFDRIEETRSSRRWKLAHV